MTKLADSCSCGAAIRLYGQGDHSDLLTRWQAEHSGDGHVQVPAEVASRVRHGKKRWSEPMWGRVRT